MTWAAALACLACCFYSASRRFSSPELIAYRQQLNSPGMAAEINGLAERLTICSGDLRDPLLPAGGFDLAVCQSALLPGWKRRTPARLCSAFRQVRGHLLSAGALPSGSQSFAMGRQLLPGPQAGTSSRSMLCPAGDRSGTQAASPGLQKRRQRPLPDFAGSPARRTAGLAIEPALLLQTSDGTPTAEVNAIYFRQQEDLS